MSKKVCSFTGHRPQNLPFRFNEEDPRCIALKTLLREEIEKQIKENEVSHFISGMALGVDTYVAEIVIDLKSTYPHITLEAAIPCETQAVKWKEKDRIRYFSLVEKCDKETLISRKYTTECMQQRNHYMVDAADAIIAVWDGTPSGTGKTVSYARSKGKTVVVIDPNKLEVLA